MKEIKNQINEKKIVVPPHSSTPCVQDISKPSKKEVIEIMQKRGYTLVYESPIAPTLNFALLKGKETNISWAVSVLLDKNAFRFDTSVNPGVVKMNTEFFTGIENDDLFSEIEQYIKDVLTKLYS